jgi:hypothetical protein
MTGSFNFEGIGVKIARIEGGIKNDEYIYLHEPSDKDKVKKSYSEIKLDKNAVLIPVPNKNIVSKTYVCGPSGSGKSYFIGNYLKEYRKMFRKSPIIVISPIDEDPALDKCDIIRLDLDDHLLDNPLTLEELEKCMVVFDDTENEKGEMKQNLDTLRDNILIRGRHTQTRMIYVSHLITNYKDTRQLLNESTEVVLYPRSSGTYHIKNYLKVQCGFEKPEITRFLSLPSRWVLLARWNPMIVMHEKGLYLPSFV